MKISIALLLAVLLYAASPALAQRPTAGRASSPARVKRNTPTVYIAFEKTLEEERSVVLELRNNTRWTLHYFLVPGSPSVGLPVLYSVEADAGLPRLMARAGDVIFSQTIAPKGKVKFLVPFAHLAKGYRIFIPFQYGWERNSRDIGQPFRSEPTHRVYFGHLDLTRSGIWLPSDED